jgi:prevent-host-death family protein
MTIVNVGEAKTSLSRLLRLVEAGEEVVIARDGTPVARLVAAVERRKPRVPGRFRGRIVIRPDFDDPLPQEVQRYFEGEGE